MVSRFPTYHKRYICKHLWEHREKKSSSNTYVCMVQSLYYPILWWDSKSAEYRQTAVSAFSFTLSTTLVHHTCAMIAKFLHQTHSNRAQGPGWCKRAVERRSGVKVWKNPAFQSKKKEKPHHPTSDIMAECSPNMDLAEQLLARLFATNTLSTSSVILPLMPLLCIIAESHGHKSAIKINPHFYMTIPHQFLLGQTYMDV